MSDERHYRCLDVGHEFACRVGWAACRQRGPGSCNDPSEFDGLPQEEIDANPYAWIKETTNG